MLATRPHKGGSALNRSTFVSHVATMPPRLNLRPGAPSITCACGASFNTDCDGGKAVKRHRKKCLHHQTATKHDRTTVRLYAVGSEWANDGLPLDPGARGYNRLPPVTLIQESSRSDGIVMYARQNAAALAVRGQWHDQTFSERIAVREANDLERAEHARDPAPCRFDPPTFTDTYALDPSWGACRRVLRLVMECEGMFTYEGFFEDGRTHAVTVGHDLRRLQNNFCCEVRNFWRAAGFRFVPHRIEVEYDYLSLDDENRRK